MSLPRYSLSFAQQSLWFMEQLSPGTAFYNIPLVLELDGPLEPAVLERTLAEIVRRHEPLRTIFPAEGGVPYQEILPTDSFALATADLSGENDETQPTALDRHIFEEITRPFDLSRGPIFRARLARLAPARHVLILVVHHIAFDGWSSGVFFRELSALYGAYSTGAPSPLPELPIRYVDFAAEQRQRLSGESFATQLAYWKEQLRPPRQVLALPTDRPRPSAQTFRGHREHATLAGELTKKLHDLSKRERATFFMTMLAAYAVFLHRLTGQHDLLIGTPIANRTRQELEPLIGFFANSLALRLDASSKASFRDLLGHARRVSIGAYANQDVPFERVVEELRPERSLSRSPLLQTFFTLDNTPRPLGDAVTAGDLRMRRRLASTGTSKFDLTLAIRHGDSGMRVSLETNADLFDAPTGQRMLRSYCELLEQIAADPNIRVAQLPLANEADARLAFRSQAQAARQDAETRAQLLGDRAGRTAIYPRDQTITQLFDEQAARSPDATAVVSGETVWSYRELNDRASRLADALQRQEVWNCAGDAAGMTPLIGLCLERSPETIVVLLAILKAGAAYVPLDPTHPEARLAAIAEQARLGLVVTRAALADRLAAVSARLFFIDDQPAAPSEREAAVERPHTAGAESLAYVLFTSGTTGTPKAVGVPHRAVVRLAFGLPEVELGEGQTMLHHSPLAFDASTFEIWGPLLHGGRIAVAPAVPLTLSTVESVVVAHGVTVMWLTASLFNAVIDERPRALAAVRYLLIGGEILSVPHVERAIAVLPDTRIFNGYGPTEATTFTCCHEITAADVSSGRSISIGRPLLNTRVYVLGSDGELVADGNRGELWIGGDGLAVGYLYDEDLTRARFVRDPFVESETARMFRTGDGVRFLPDGTLEFLGRLDEQIKLRGFRIEPGEVEAAIDRHSRIARCAVVAVEHHALGRMLVAFVVPAASPVAGADAAPASHELRDFLRDLLPDYMVPSQWMALDTLPLAATGKVDRAALRALALSATSDRSTAASPPRTGTEEAVAAIWRDLLGIAEVGTHDNFFERGGHSLLATQALSRMQATFGVDIGLQALFETPTVAGLAQAVDRLLPTAATAPAPVHASPAEAPRNERAPATAAATSVSVEAALLDIWRDHLANQEITLDDNFFNLGGHSLLAARLCAAIQKHLGVDMPVSTLFTHDTIAKQARLIRSGATADDWSPLVPIQPIGAEPPFFLVHGIGGEVISFQTLARHVGTDCPIYGLRAEERLEAMEPASIETIAARYVRAIRAVVPAGPYRIGGYSAGGIIAYEMAQQLFAAGDVVSPLIMLDAPAPVANAPALTLSAPWRLARNFAYWLVDDDFFRSGWNDQRARLRAKTRLMWAHVRAAASGSSATIDLRDQLGLWRMPAQANTRLERYVRMRRAYRPREYPGPLTLLRARTGRLTYRGGPDLGWERLARGGVTTRIIPGAHDTILREPRVRRLAAELVASLERRSTISQEVT